MTDTNSFDAWFDIDAADAYVAEIIESPECSHWMRNALETALTRDVVDAANDAEAVSLVLQMRASAVLNGAPRHTS